MSENMISKGYFGKLTTPVGDHTTDAWETRQNSLPNGFELNYDGTLIFSNDQKPTYEVDGPIFAEPEAQIFRDQVEALGYEVSQVKFYVCHWYNGADSPMSTADTDIFL